MPSVATLFRGMVLKFPLDERKQARLARRLARLIRARAQEDKEKLLAELGAVKQYFKFLNKVDDIYNFQLFMYDLLQFRKKLKAFPDVVAKLYELYNLLRNRLLSKDTSPRRRLPPRRAALSPSRGASCEERREERGRVLTRFREAASSFGDVDLGAVVATKEGADWKTIVLSDFVTQGREIPDMTAETVVKHKGFDITYWIKPTPPPSLLATVLELTGLGPECPWRPRYFDFRTPEHVSAGIVLECKREIYIVNTWSTEEEDNVWSSATLEDLRAAIQNVSKMKVLFFPNDSPDLRYLNIQDSEFFPEGQCQDWSLLVGMELLKNFSAPIENAKDRFLAAFNSFFTIYSIRQDLPEITRRLYEIGQFE